MSVAVYPVHVDASLDPTMSRWLWLVKWLLAIPHYVVLFFLWIAFAVVSVLAFFAILITGSYPRTLFDFNVGVLRWSWRVAYYAYGVLGTDHYPPFTLGEVAQYPAHLDIEYPAHLSRGLVLVKWWLLAIPHYVVVGIFIGGGAWLWQSGDAQSAGAPGLIGLLVFFAAVVLLFTGRYPQQLFDFVLGMNRWVLRVAAYAGLMTDEYPPFRLDMGGREPGAAMTVSPPPPPAAPPSTAPPPAAPPSTAPPSGAPPTTAPPVTPPPSVPPPSVPPPTTPPPSPPSGRGWTAGRVVVLVIGAVLILASLGFLSSGGIATWATHTQRDQTGYLTSDAHTFATSTYAITSDRIDLGASTDTYTPAGVLGTVRVRVTATSPVKGVFVGVGRKSAVDAYLGGASHMVITNWANGESRLEGTAGATPVTTPATAGVWKAYAFGTGTQTLRWRPTGGQWVVVVMNPSGSAVVSATADIGATVPDLGWIGVGLLIAGVVLLVAGVVMVVVPVSRASR